MTDGGKNTATCFLEQCVAIDLELGRDEHIRDIGGVLGGTASTFRRAGHSAAALDALDAFSEKAKFLLGHNVADFDVPHLATERPTLRLLRLPVVDTLWLNPLAFPRNPYHHLVKHYKDGALLRDHRNNPVEDARLSLQLFDQQWQALTETGARDPDRLAAWHWLTTVDDRISGMSQVFAALRGQARPTRAQAFETIARCLAGQCCRNAQQQALDEAQTDGWPLAYALAWLSVATVGNSVMPPWVRHRIPAAARLLHRLRNVGCTDEGCTWCREHHNAPKALKHWFNLPGFRPEPKEEATGRPLQQVIVEAAMGGRHVLGILPTGTGKSVCYQIPALSRFENTGALTVVVSPLVALMADQVAGLKKHGIESSAAINGLLSPVERKQVLDGVRLGEIGILIVSPEQLRNPGLRRALAQREIGGWVLDEAHCLSKWGQDFRPDYRYVARFIRESAGEQPIPPVLCLTATAKPSVIEDIVAHFRNELRIELGVFNGGARRDNLELLVQRTHPDRKFADVFALIEQELPPERQGGAIVYCATRKGVEDMATFLRDKGLAASHFHSKLPPETKKNVQAKFIGGELRVIAATNAFGMGIDKPDVRLVVHADIPGSLENYLQEAGRAGRDRQAARCVLLYTDDDVERQFGMSARSRLTPKEIRAILNSLRNLDKRRRKSRQVGETLVATTGEILLEDEDGEFQRDTATDDTRVKTAVSWLEDAQLLEREENQIQVFPSSLRIASVEEAREKLKRSPVPPEYRKQLLAIAEALVNADGDQGISTDELIGLSGLSAAKLHKAFADLEALGIARNDTALTVFVHVGVQRSSRQRLEAAIAMETDLLRELRELAPDFAKGDSSSLQLRLACQRLRDRAAERAKAQTKAGEQDRELPDVLPDTVRRLLKGIADDGRDEDSESGSLTVSRIDGENVRVTLNREWAAMDVTARVRRQAGRCLLEHLHAALPSNVRGTDLLAETTMGNLLAALDADLVIKAESGTRDLHKLLHRSLLWLHDQEIVRLNKGLMVFRQAMTLRLNTDWTKKFAKSDYEPLSFHYDEQKTQVHVIARYANLGLEIMQEARDLAADYFRLPTQSFLQTWLPGRDKELQRQTTPQSWARIVEDLRNKTQRDIVADDRENAHMLVLAGPGSGKTRVLVHRIAYLIRVRRENPGGILALAYNRHAAVQIRRRLVDLVGDDARGVIVLTLHAFAMRLVGASFAERNPTEKEDGFTAILRDAIALLKGESRSPEDADALRDRLLGGFRWILVDEYQDIGPEQYELVSAIAGRTRAEGEDRPGLFAVGDDDQNIYTFNHTSVDFIRRFETDYGAKPTFLVENFRSTAHIVAASNDFIRRHPERLKADHPIRVDKAREKAPPGGAWQGRDAVGKGRVQILHAGRDPRQQALAVVQELQRLAALDPQWDWSHCAIVARNWYLLGPVRARCEQLGIPVQSADEESLPLWRLRETQALLDWLGTRGSRLARAADMNAWVEERRRFTDNPWLAQLAAAIGEYAGETANEELPIAHFREWLAELGRDLRHRQAGLLLASVHRAKGMEFDHVAVLDGDWDAKKNDADEQRRLYYVAMTRARETLALCRFDNRPHAFLDALDEGSHLLHRAPVDLSPVPEELNRQYVFPSLREINLGFAGRERGGNPVHEAISRLSPGTPLSLANVDGAWYLLHGNVRVGKMSGKFDVPAGVQCRMPGSAPFWSGTGSSPIPSTANPAATAGKSSSPNWFSNPRRRDNGGPFRAALVSMSPVVPSLTSYRKYWAQRFGVAPFLPMSRAEMDALGWDSCDVILVTGDAYIDHPSFGMALVGRLLEAQGFRVGIISQPDWRSAHDFKRLGRPNLFFGITAGNMDSMVNRYTSDRKIRSDDAYTPNGAADKRPDRAVVVYAQRAREAYAETPVVIGGIEASLRRIAHYDYWSDKVRRSVLPDSKADLLLYGNAERALVELTHRLAKGEAIADIRDLRGTAFMALRGWTPAGDWIAIDAVTGAPAAQGRTDRAHEFIRLPAYEEVANDAALYAQASRAFHLESNPGNARCIAQAHGERDVWLNPPPIPLSTAEMDHVYGLPYARAPHPAYEGARIPAWEMIRHSINIMRGCFGGCTFCSITEHEGRIIQSRSEASILREIEEIRDKTAGFTGIVSDLGGPTANMYRMACKDKAVEAACRRLSCVYPDICPRLSTDHAPLISLYRKARAIPGVKKVLIGSGLRYDLAVRSPEYVKELASHHVGGYLKIAPEHTESGPLSKMMKPGMAAYDKFKRMFDAASQAAGKEQYLIPYFIAAHPGTTDEDMLELALWLKRNGFRLDQVQTFLPTPLAIATAMYHTEKNPLRRVDAESERVAVVRGGRQRKLHKAFLRYHDAENWPLLREALRQMGRADLIGNGKKHLIPAWQPAGTQAAGASRTSGTAARPASAARKMPAPRKTPDRRKR